MPPGSLASQSHAVCDAQEAGWLTLLFLALLGGGIFATLGLAGSQARGATFLAFLVGGLVALLMAYSYVRLSLTYPGEGGTVTFLNRAFGHRRFAGGLNTLLVLSYVIIMALYASAFANYASGLLPGLASAIGPQALAALAALPARSSGLPQRLAARHSVA